ncbi:hypothetical protein KYJ26_12290 [Bacillus sp. MCCB 382]|uniref:5' nucleotidase, NT5C type n=1 Tax=Bacillus sp. MCCB 382 TaxID=2860197 RepID=UPI001C56B97D|nr:hypothetical protein [Bacillus sp. MCCB 382]
MKRIAIDMDEVMADLHKKHLDLFNRDYNENLTIDDLIGTRLWKIRPHNADDILAYQSWVDGRKISFFLYGLGGLLLILMYSNSFAVKERE